MFLKISQNSLENNCTRASFLIKLQAAVCNFFKKNLVHVLLWKFCEIFKNGIFYEHPHWLRLLFFRTTVNNWFCYQKSSKTFTRKNFAKFSGKHPSNFSRQRFFCKCFPVNLSAMFQNTSRWLLLDLYWNFERQFLTLKGNF